MDDYGPIAGGFAECEHDKRLASLREKIVQRIGILESQDPDDDWREGELRGLNFVLALIDGKEGA